jgi:hypothetical protein
MLPINPFSNMMIMKESVALEYIRSFGVHPGMDICQYYTLNRTNDV